jgi:hypothetical protein
MTKWTANASTNTAAASTARREPSICGRAYRRNSSSFNQINGHPASSIALGYNINNKYSSSELLVLV